MNHPWKSRGDKRTIVGHYKPQEEVMKYLTDMQNAIRYAIEVAYEMAIRDYNRIPSPIALRKAIKPWFVSNYDYAIHHLGPVSAVAMLWSYKKNHHGELRIPVVKKLEMRIDGELFKIEGDRVRVTLQPGHYAYVPINTENKHYHEYSKGKASELLLTDNFVCITFTISEKERTLSGSFVAQDFTIDSTFAG
ncbi:MAG: hypothetical protein QXO39_05535 [Conexivisphaerales archaeon]